MRDKMKRFGKNVVLPAVAATVMAMADMSVKYMPQAGQMVEPLR